MSRGPGVTQRFVLDVARLLTLEYLAGYGVVTEWILQTGQTFPPRNRLSDMEVDRDLAIPTTHLAAGRAAGLTPEQYVAACTFDWTGSSGVVVETNIYFFDGEESPSKPQTRPLVVDPNDDLPPASRAANASMRRAVWGLARTRGDIFVGQCRDRQICAVIPFGDM